jgi:hypothetical protein
VEVVSPQSSQRAACTDYNLKRSVPDKRRNRTRVDLRNALINAGEDMGQQTVSDSKFVGESSITRADAFSRLLKRGMSPAQIDELAKKKPEEVKAE